MKLIVILVIILAVIAVAQMMRVYELSSKLRDRKEEHIPRRFNELNAIFMIVFMVLFFAGMIYLIAVYGKGGLGPAASEHGADVDWLFDLNWLIVLAVFFITNFLLFFFSYKYYHREERRAHWFPHNNKLELIWTIVPALVLAVIIILGLKTWNEVTAPPSDDAVIVEVYSKQFDWTVRYSGEDNMLGNADYKLINATNALGVVTSKTLDERIIELENEIIDLKNKLASETAVVSEVKEIEIMTKIDRLTNVSRRLHELKRRNDPNMDSLDIMAMDDRIVKGEMHLKLGQEYFFVFRSQDVIHSAYFPHFRAQMNTVPGMRTTFKFTPTITTDSMRMITNNPDFDYYLLCNKICGLSHSNMYMKVIVDSEDVYNDWMSQQKTVKDMFFTEEVAEADKPVDESEAVNSAESTEPENAEDQAAIENENEESQKDSE